MIHWKTFSVEGADSIVARLDKLDASTQPLWGKMSVSKMVKHCQIPYLEIEGKIKRNPSLFMKIIMRILIKKKMIDDSLYAKNLPTAPHFIIDIDPDFEFEKEELKSKVLALGITEHSDFEGRKHSLLGTLKASEWDTMLYKHIDHHLRQFGV